ncbi:MAG: sulfite exporter TauE/SafE family protein, partial [Proteobacteria bacterium]|nr:sulfite exporter TauE/SafE family protein [Pseudomonadota bacterium]
LVGSRTMARRLDSRKVRRLFTIVLLGIAVKLYWEIFVG